MMVLVLAAIALAVAAGVYLTLSRDLFRMIAGLALLGAAVNLVVFTAGRLASAVPPLIGDGIDAGAAAAAHPLVQALVLTAIVISFALLCFALVLGAGVSRSGGDDADALRAAEPAPTDPVKPPELDD